MKNIKDDNKITRIFCNYKNIIFSTAISIPKNNYDAEDAVSEAMINIIKIINKIDEIECNKTRCLIVIIVRNICFNILKKSKSRNERALDDIEYELADSNISIEDYVISQETYDKIIEYMAKLNDNYADILRLRYIYEFNDKEIAKVLNISDGAVRTKLNRARNALIKELEKGGIVHE